MNGILLQRVLAKQVKEKNESPPNIRSAKEIFKSIAISQTFPHSSKSYIPTSDHAQHINESIKENEKALPKPTIAYEMNQDLINETLKNRKTVQKYTPEHVEDIKKKCIQAYYDSESEMVDLKNKCEKYHPPSDGRQYYDLDADKKHTVKAINALDPNGNPAVLTVKGLCGVPWWFGWFTIATGGKMNENVTDFVGDCPSTKASINFVETLHEMGLVQLVDEDDNFPVMGVNSRLCPIRDEQIKEQLARKRRGEISRFARTFSCPKYKEEEAELRAMQLLPYYQCCKKLGILVIDVNLSGINPKKNGSHKILEMMNEHDVVPVAIYNILHMQFFSTNTDGREEDQLLELSNIFEEVFEMVPIIEEITKATRDSGVMATLTRLMPKAKKKKTFDKLFIEKAGIDFTEGREVLKAAQKAGLKRYHDKLWNEQYVSIVLIYYTCFTNNILTNILITYRRLNW